MDYRFVFCCFATMIFPNVVELVHYYNSGHTSDVPFFLQLVIQGVIYWHAGKTYDLFSKRAKG